MLNNSIEVYHEASLHRTIVELRATDYVGLLYQLSKAIFDLGFNISFAKVTTKRGVVIDTFYIAPIIQHQNIDQGVLNNLRETLSRIVDNDSLDDE